MIYEMPEGLQIKGMSEIVNKKVNEQLEQFFYDLSNDIDLCESPLEELFCIEIIENFRYYSFKKSLSKLNYEVLEFRIQEEIGKYRVDFALYVNEIKKIISESTVKKFVIEIDGHDFHEKTKEQAKRDKEKDRFLTSEGYTVVRFTGSEIYNNYEEKVREFLEMVLKVCGR